MTTIGTTKASAVFHEGDRVVVARGGYMGTPGVFLNFRQDPKWADITETDGTVRAHPVEWLDHSSGSTEGNRTV